MNKSVTAGSKIKAIREAKSVSLDTVAERTGLTANEIELIEGGASLSLAPMLKIARALGVRLGTFLDDATADGPVVCRKDEQTDGVRMNSSPSASKHLNYYSLARTKPGRYMEPFLIEIENISGDDFTFSSHEGEEFLYCFEGTVEVVYGNQKYRLEPGDSIYYDSVIDHRLQALDGKAKVLAVIYAPV